MYADHVAGFARSTAAQSVRGRSPPASNMSCWALISRSQRCKRRGVRLNSLAMAERLAKADPGNARWQRDLALSHGRVAMILVRQGERARAQCLSPRPRDHPQTESFGSQQRDTTEGLRLVRRTDRGAAEAIAGPAQNSHAGVAGDEPRQTLPSTSACSSVNLIRTLTSSGYRAGRLGVDRLHGCVLRLPGAPRFGGDAQSGSEKDRKSSRFGVRWGDGDDLCFWTVPSGRRR